MLKFDDKRKNITARTVLWLAGLYNLAWGTLVSIYPEIILFGNQESAYLLILSQCLGMVVGVYGLAYWFASQDPARYWPIILVGLIGKVLGPIGAIVFIFKGDLPLKFLYLNIGNDLIWIMPFSWVLCEVYQRGLAVEVSESGSLYEEWLGVGFNNLAPNLHRFHRAKSPIKVRGEFQVLRGSNFLTKWMGEVSKLPSESKSEDVELLVVQEGRVENWHRRIGSHKMISQQQMSHKYLVEKFGLIYVYLDAKVEVGELYICDHSVSFCGLPFPPFFTPWVKAHGKDEEGGILITVEVGFYPLGRIIKYQGSVTIDSQ